MIKVIGKTLRKVEDTGQGLARVEPAEVAAALGADRTRSRRLGQLDQGGSKFVQVGTPRALLALRLREGAAWLGEGA